MIQIQKLTFTIGTRTLFSNLSFTIDGSKKIGLIGANGAGKSTLFKIISGALEAQSGKIIKTAGWRIAVLSQEEVDNSQLSVWDYVTQSLYVKEEVLAYETQKQISNVLKGLGFLERMYHQAATSLSMGWRMRLALATVLLTDAELYLLDEPTNHLDVKARLWLQSFLKDWGKAFVLVSHDLDFLQAVTNYTFEIEHEVLHMFNGPVKSYLVHKEAVHAHAIATRNQQEKVIARKQQIADRFRAGTRSRQAQSLLKDIENIDLVAIPQKISTVRFNFPPPSWSSTRILLVKNVSYIHPNAVSPCLENISFEINKKEKIALVAPNGMGKTTLLRCIARQIIPQQGSIVYGAGISIGFFQQNQSESLPLNKTIWQYLQDICPDAHDQMIKNVLGGFLFSGRDIHKSIAILSGGEKNRVALAALLCASHNILLFDEPTNHLDIYTKNILTQALQEYPGAMILISHESDFLSHVATRVIELCEKGIINFPGTYDEWMHQLPSSADNKASIAMISSPQAENATKCAEEKMPETLSKKMRQLEYAIAKIEQKEQALLKKIEQLSPQDTSFLKAIELLGALAKEKKELEVEWEHVYTN